MVTKTTFKKKFPDVKGMPESGAYCCTCFVM